MPVLHVHDRESNAQRMLSFNKPRFVIGKLGTADLVIDKHNISRNHCEIITMNGGHFIRDVGSRNGTFMDQR